MQNKAGDYNLCNQNSQITLLPCAYLMERVTCPTVGVLPYTSRKEKPQKPIHLPPASKTYWENSDAEILLGYLLFPIFWSQLDKKCLEIRVSRPERMMEPKFPLPQRHVLPSLRSLWTHRYFNFAGEVSHCLTPAPVPYKPCLMALFWGQTTGIAGLKPPKYSKQEVVHLTPSSENLPDDPYQSNQVRDPW